jgi:hypothetical protein
MAKASRSTASRAAEAAATNPLAGVGFSDRDYAIAVGTLMGESLREVCAGWPPLPTCIPTFA